MSAVGSSGMHSAARHSRAQDTETWSLEVGDDLAMDRASIDCFDPAIFEGSVSTLCLCRPNLFDFFRCELVETLKKFLGQLGALIEREVQHLLREFVEVLHFSIVPVA